jgi:hypothetical protein
MRPKILATPAAAAGYNQDGPGRAAVRAVFFMRPGFDQEDIMSNGAEGAAVAAIARAVKASGVLVRLAPEEFLKVLNRIEAPLIVVSPGTFLSRKNSTLTSYKGLAFFTGALDRFPLPGRCEIISAGSIGIP